MAGVSTKEIKNRIRSMESTKQITKAMEMVAASKLRRAQAQVLNSRPYFEILKNTIDQIVATNRDFSSPYLVTRPVKKALYLVIAGDRGLAGGYNSNILKLVESEMEGKDAVVLPIGKKAVDHFRARRTPMLSENYAEAADISIGDCFSISKQLSRAFLSGEFDEIHVAYTNFVSVLSQTPACMKLLPLTAEQPHPTGASDILYEPDSTEVFEAIVPEYLGGIVYGALCESRAAEQAARRTAMDAATSNAEDMIADLSLKFNQARQAAITQEITEIVAGS
ncbi:MAG: ATP synthase F1 subunit gamma [Clostridiales bacterium]|nr:ATP synthase F1 subunit gamma [Clostridiales bacterium]MDD7387202.1 ATP synthase F1 subunit gamma [Bacillota bacterium]MDY6040750.1 ATP synthase F1 subunit gamma [Candidatus Faecousia sp.]